MGKFERFLTGRGYYAVIVIALLAVGVSAFAATRDGLAERSEQQTPKEETPIVEYREPEEDGQSVSIPQQGVEAEEPDAAEEPSQETDRTGGEETGEQEDEGGGAALSAEEPEGTETSASAAPQLQKPVPGKVMNPHSEGASVYSETMQDYRQHDGVDLAAAVGDEVCAAADGTIDGLYFDDLWGQVVVISHSGGVKTTYKNLSSEVPDGIYPGARVTAGQRIGVIGDEGIIESAGDAHLHFEVEKNGENVNPATLIAFE